MADTRKIDEKPAAGGPSPSTMPTLVPDLPDRRYRTLKQPGETASQGDFGEVSIWRLPKVIAAVGLTKSGIYSAIHHDGFPKPIRLGRRAVGWRAIDVVNWLEARPYSPSRRHLPLTKPGFRA
jgi:prophage regulatory protein